MRPSPQSFLPYISTELQSFKLDEGGSLVSARDCLFEGSRSRHQGENPPSGGDQLTVAFFDAGVKNENVRTFARDGIEAVDDIAGSDFARVAVRGQHDTDAGLLARRSLGEGGRAGVSTTKVVPYDRG